MLVHAPGTPQQNRKPDKRRKYGRIDAVVAALMAIGSLKADTDSVDVKSLIA
jgi:phage terminase large subunit-like protein